MYIFYGLTDQAMDYIGGSQRFPRFSKTVPVPVLLSSKCFKTQGFHVSNKQKFRGSTSNNNFWKHPSPNIAVLIFNNFSPVVSSCQDLGGKILKYLFRDAVNLKQENVFICSKLFGRPLSEKYVYSL